MHHENRLVIPHSYALQLETIFRGKYPASGFSADNFEVNPADELERGLALFHADNLINIDTLSEILERVNFGEQSLIVYMRDSYNVELVEELIARLKELVKLKEEE